MAAVLLLTLVNVLGYSIMIPVFPFIVDTYHGGALTYGILLSSYSLFQFLGAPLLGSLADKYGRRPLLIISNLGTLLGWLIFAAAYFIPTDLHLGVISIPIAVIIISRIVDGITGGNISVSNAYASDITPAREKTKVFGYMGALVGLGFIIGPAIGGYSSSFGINYLGTILVSAGITVISIILMWYFLPESLPEKKRAKHLQIHILKEINFFEKLMKFKSNRFIQKLFFIRMFLAFMFSAYTSIVVLFLKEYFHLTAKQLGLLFLLFGLFLIFNQTYITNRLARKYGDLQAFYIGQIVMTLGMVVIIFIPNFWLLLVVSYFLNIGISMSMVTFKSLIANHVGESRQGEINGLDESVLAGASAFAPLLAGYLYENIFRYTFPIFSLGLLIPHIVLWWRSGKILLKEPKP